MKVLKLTLFVISAAFLFGGCGSDDDNTIDKTKPTLDISKSAFQNCTEVKKGVPFTFSATVSDNEALGSYSFDIHHNFDHHSHTTEAGITECKLGKKKKAIKPFKSIKTFKIPNNPKEYTISQQFTVPTEYDSGDYHFMVKVVDKAGWTTLKGLSFKVVD